MNEVNSPNTDQEADLAVVTAAANLPPVAGIVVTVAASDDDVTAAVEVAPVTEPAVAQAVVAAEDENRVNDGVAATALGSTEFRDELEAVRLLRALANGEVTREAARDFLDENYS